MQARLWTITAAFLGLTITRAQDLRFQHLTAEDGLSDNAVTCLFEDRAGYIWIGTERGLNRYDGQRVERFMAGPNGPGGDYISSIAEDARGDLWITSVGGGLARRHLATGRFTHLRRDSTDACGLPTDLLNHVLVLDDSLLLLSSRGGGAIWYHLRHGVVRRLGFRPVEVNAHGDTTARTEDNWCHTALRLDDRRIWLTMLGTTGSHVVDARSGDLIERLATSGISTNGVHLDGMLYMGGWSAGIQRVDPGRPDVVSHFPIEDEVTGMVEWDDRHLLAATKVNGLVLLDKAGALIERYRHARSDRSSLGSDRTTCLMRDRARNLWVGTSKGVSVYAPPVWRTSAIPLLPENRVGDLVFHALQQDDDGTIRISTSKGFILVDPVSRTSRIVELSHAGAHMEVTGLFKTGPGEWFAGTETGIFRYDPESERILPEAETRKWSSYHEGSMFQTRAVWPSSIGGRDLLLLGALGYGHIAIDHATSEDVEEWVDYLDERGTMMLRSTMQDAHGTCWSATLGGVVRWTPVATGGEPNGTVFSTQAKAEHRLPGDDAQGLARQSDTVWVALRDAGVASIVGDRTRAHAPPAHLPHDVLGLTVDRSGMVWCATSNGLLRYAPRTGGWLHVDVNDGRAFRQLTKCITTLRDGRVALCADDHLLLFDPSAYRTLPDLPVPWVVKINNTWGALETDTYAQLELQYRNSAFDVMLTALQPVGAAPLTFLCRLDDEGTGYREVTAREPLRYAGVAVGTHRLLVRVRDAFGREGPEHALLIVTIAGPFWQQWWFFLLVLAAGALGTYLVSRLRTKQRAKLQGVRDRIARDLHDDIGSTLGSISFYSEALRRKMAGSSDGISQDVAEKIGSSSREMIDRMSDIVWSVDPKNDDAGALIERLQSFAKDLLSAKDIALDFRADPDLAERKLSAEQRRNLFLICKEALYNTVKYADAGKVTIAIYAEGRGLSIILNDDGCGFDPDNTDSYNGNGLVNMRTRANAINAVFTLTTSPGNGTEVNLRLPVQEFVPRSGD
ncbi:MAG: hypothetical protein IPL52_18175 [Flavobacteriales bacterium]|nr:hypothetical protein [Flavobacteriales bacterium]